VIQAAVNTVTGDITIADDGPGIPPETIAGVLDFNVRGSAIAPAAAAQPPLWICCVSRS
jgi:hypothetical protein